MKKKITGKDIVAYVGWLSMSAAVVLVLMTILTNIVIPVPVLLLSIVNGLFCLYSGYIFNK